MDVSGWGWSMLEVLDVACGVSRSLVVGVVVVEYRLLVITDCW